VTSSATHFTILANIRMPSEKAHVLQTMQMADAFSKVFDHVQIIYSRRANTAAMEKIVDLYEYYGVGETFRLIGLPSIDAIKRASLDWSFFNRFPFIQIAHLVQLLSFTLNSMLYVATLGGGVIFSRDLLLLVAIKFASLRKDRTYVFEVHTLPRSSFSRWLHLWAARRFDHIVVISDAISEFYLQAGFQPSKILIARDGFNEGLFSSLPSKSVAQLQIGIPKNCLVAVYAGHFYPWKGVDTLLEASFSMDNKWFMYLIGGTGRDLERVRAGAADNVCVLEHMSQLEASRYLAAADVLLIPNTGAEAISSLYTSPLKLFEYMAVGRPIIASNVQAISSVLTHEVDALLVPPDNPNAIVAALERLSYDTTLAKRLGTTASLRAREFTWGQRAVRIKRFITEC
tara:strand:- start:1211 stop:2413 length:1203 start_codon:yes stop_codon:yes gene_type:complete